MSTVVLPDDLAALPPGPGMAAVLAALDLSAVPNDRMLEVLVAQQRQLSHEQARMAATLAELGRCAGSVPKGRVVRLAAMDRYAPDETRAALRWTRGAAEFEHDVAESVVHAMPELWAAWLAGGWIGRGFWCSTATSSISLRSRWLRSVVRRCRGRRG